ncbi:LPS export ABC transporter periplasmic protein LptC [Pseudorhodoplanes sp.]|uniref:LPS export ABC transporter periplasmic protein LptC n=1 Tax=Pseudorhodoplanes sp. TaxID=1934341 RepID=UPI002C2E3E5B|nr:LPS export ABC transporter periplasmic protein LptC [Pseudorhodoplanes sp.]HWV53237.1 LPS export ABC transporter periplasmic protein LptC [Pseudorhodoplanes sp.]
MNRMLAGPEDWGQPGQPAAGRPKAVISGARKHSRRVRLLRRAVPVALVLALGGLMAANYLNPARWLKIPTEFGTLVISGSTITMEAPRLAGFTRDQREYEVTAASASQDTKNPTIVEMKRISGRIDMEDKSKVTLSAVEGIYDTKADLLKLNQEILIISTAGYQGRLTEAQVEVKKGRIVSEKPVQLKMPQGTLDANRMEVTETGGNIRFDGGVVMMLTPEALNRGMQSQAANQANAQ